MRGKGGGFPVKYTGKPIGTSGRPGRDKRIERRQGRRVRGKQ